MVFETRDFVDSLAVLSRSKDGPLDPATFASVYGPDGPERCSGLPVKRYSPDGLHGEFGSSFELIEHASEAHKTPMSNVQPSSTVVGNPCEGPRLPARLREFEAGVARRSGMLIHRLVAEDDLNVMARQVGPHERKPEHGRAPRSARPR